MHSSSIKTNRYTLLLIVAAVLYSDACYADFKPPMRVTAGALGTELSWPAELTVYRDNLYFTAEDASGTRSLWQSNGQSTARILMPPEMLVGPGPAEMTVFHDQLIFAAVDRQAGYQLWTYDGTQVRRATQNSPTTFQGMALNPVEFKDHLYFVPWSDGVTQALRTYDGHSVDFAPGIPPETFTQISRVLASTQDYLYLAAWQSSSSHESLWKYDGNQLTALPDIIDPRTPTPIMPNDISDFTEFNGQLYFVALNRSNYDGYHLWRFDGQQFEMLPGIDDIRSNLVVRDNRLFVMAGETPKTYTLGGDPPIIYTDSWRRAELWSYDGQRAEQLTHAGIGPFAGYDGNSEVFDSGDGLLIALSTNLGREVWRYNGDELALAANVNQILKLDTVLPFEDDGSNPGSFTLYRGDVYFIADDGIHGRGLWSLPHATAIPEPLGRVLVVLASLLACTARHGRWQRE